MFCVVGVGGVGGCGVRDWGLFRRKLVDSIFGDVVYRLVFSLRVRESWVRFPASPKTVFYLSSFFLFHMFTEKKNVEW